MKEKEIKTDGYISYLTSISGGLVTNPIKTGRVVASTVSDISTNYEFKNNFKSDLSVKPKGIFGFSNDFGTDLAIASCVLF